VKKDEADDLTERARAVAQACFPLLAHHGSEVQGAALGELVALHIAGHIIPGDRARTESMRAMVLEQFVSLVKDLVPLVEATHILPRLNN
jgi:hypothetical protein